MPKYDFSTPETSPKDLNPDSVQSGIEWVGLALAIVVLALACFGA